MAVLMQAETEMLSGVVQESTNAAVAAALVGEGRDAFRPRPALCYKGNPYKWLQMTVQNDSVLAQQAEQAERAMVDRAVLNSHASALEYEQQGKAVRFRERARERETERKRERTRERERLSEI